jgi:virginiamycin A acetyltransferase
LQLPDPDELHPLPGHGLLVFLKPLLARRRAEAGGPRNVEVGDYSYYDDHEDPLPFFERNVRYNHGFSGARLVIGRYCALASGTTFIMPDANHAVAGTTTFPFPIFGGDWAGRLPVTELPVPAKGDTVVGHDVWFGYESLVMPGVTIGSGAVIGARSVVTRDVPPYAIVAGNPARVVRRRYDDATVARLLDLAWWDWPVERVTEAIPDLVHGHLDRLSTFTRQS